ncbi:hypothetical protein Cpir12675_006437 [Ceratocystis pirilliformis]|uniref:Uncharacterized protein n=1 Tax=Ceratocystis pirilliformis TaxID=259994 RepID=A0ABR3YHD2_9PEZI
METLPTLLTTYGISRSFAQCTVSEVAKAASAANNLSGSIKTGEDEEVFIDAQYGYNNPCEVLISETKRQFPDRELIILSIGTGVNDVVEIKDAGESLNLAFSRIATTSKQSDLRLKNIYGGSGVYHRFDVENGLRDSKSQSCQRVGSIAAHTRNYVQENETSIMEFVKAFTGARSSLLVQPRKEYGEHYMEKSRYCHCANNSIERSPSSVDYGENPRPRSPNHGQPQQKPPRTNWVNSCMGEKESRLKSWWSNTAGSKAQVKRMMNFLSPRKR